MGDAIEEMRRAIDRVEDDPKGVAASAEDALRRLGTDAGRTTLGALAWWAAGLAAREQNDLADADMRFLAGIDAAESAAEVELASEIRCSRSLVLAYRGEIEAALDQLADAETGLDDVAAGRVIMQRALVLQRAGRLADAMEAFDRAAPAVEAADDPVLEVRLRSNRAIAATYLHRFGRAEDDLVRARTLAGAMGNAFQVASCSHNLGFLHGRRGDVPVALSWFDQVAEDDPRYVVDARSASVVLLDRAEVLMGAGMAAEALAVSERARAHLDDSENEVEVAEADLVLARIALAAGDRATAMSSARAAAAAFVGQGRGSWCLVADAIAFLAEHGSVGWGLRLGSDDPDRTALADVASSADSLAASLRPTEWWAEWRAIATLAGSLWHHAGQPARAIERLGPVAVSRRQGSAVHRVHGWQAEAMIRHIRGDEPGVRRAIHAGLDTIAGYRTTMAATDLRATISTIGDRLASWLVELALDRGPRDLLRASEAWRAGALVAPVVASPDPEIERLLAALRATDAERRVGGIGVDAERARLETAVRDRVRRGRGDGTGPRDRFDPAALADALDDRVLVSFIAHRDRLHAVVVADGRVSRYPVGPVEHIADEIASMRSCLQRLARAAGSARSIDAARTALTVAGDRVSSSLFGARVLGSTRPVVVVPTGLLHSVPWAALPALRERPFVVAPSAKAWLKARSREMDRHRGLLLAAGPDLAGAESEVRRIAAGRAGVRLLVGDDASVEAVLAGMSGVGLAHFAAHGDFRADNPQLGAIQMADGDIRVYDLERLGELPPVIVLSACDVGSVAATSGDEIQGFAAAVLGAGAASLVAPLVPVHDEATASLLTRFHVALRDGCRPDEALCVARNEQVDPGAGPAAGAAALAAAGSFVAFGS